MFISMFLNSLYKGQTIKILKNCNKSDQDAAKLALSQSLKLLTKCKAETTYKLSPDSGWYSHSGHLKELMHIWYSLNESDYIGACERLSFFIKNYPIFQQRILYATILLLNTFVGADDSDF